MYKRFQVSFEDELYLTELCSHCIELLRAVNPRMSNIVSVADCGGCLTVVLCERSSWQCIYRFGTVLSCSTECVSMYVGLCLSSSVLTRCVYLLSGVCRDYNEKKPNVCVVWL